MARTGPNLGHLATEGAVNSPLNFNKLFPRLTISAKLSIAFAVLTVLPLTVVAAFMTPMAVSQLRGEAEEGLAKDLELVRLRVASGIREAEQHLSFLVDAFIDPLFRAPDSGRAGREAALAATFLRTNASAVLRIQAIDANGHRTFEASRLPRRSGEDHLDEGTGLYYLLVAEQTPAGGRALLPVELQDPSAGGEEVRVIPAIAIVQPIRGTRGELLGVAVAEAAASALFSSLDVPPPGRGQGHPQHEWWQGLQEDRRDRHDQAVDRLPRQRA